MKLATTTAAVALSLFAGEVTAQTDTSPPGAGDEAETNIIGGNQAPAGEWPAYVADHERFGKCGGSLIDRQWVLTAAHCDGDVFDSGVRIGVENIKNLGDGIHRGVVQKIPHPNYDKNTFKNDIMLLKLESPVIGVTPFEYEKSSSTSKPADGSVLTVMGFGYTRPGASASDFLMQVNVNTAPYDTCIDQYAPLYGSQAICESVMFCAGAKEGGKDSCGPGDSGGPIVNAYTKVQVGIVSWGEGCASADYAGVYTRVGAFSEWIDCIIENGNNHNNNNNNNCPLGGEGSCGAGPTPPAPTTVPGTCENSRCGRNFNEAYSKCGTNCRTHWDCPGTEECHDGLTTNLPCCSNAPPPQPAPQAPILPSPSPGPKTTSQRRLQSTASKSFNPGDETYQTYLKLCGNFEYPLSLYVDQHSHLLVYGVPPKAAVAVGCPFGAAHVVFANRQGKSVAEKEILMWSHVEEGQSMFKEGESLPIGTFKLLDLAKAYEATPNDDVAIGRGGMYDIVTNNCATFLIKMASTLGVKIDSRMTSFVAKRLVEESGKDLADKVRNSMHYFSFFGPNRNLRSSTAIDKLSDQEIVEALVNKGVSVSITNI